MLTTSRAALLLAVAALLFCQPAFVVPDGMASLDAWRDNDWFNTRAFDSMTREALFEHGQIPLRNPLVGAGFPTIAHPSDGSLSPSLLPVLFLGVPLGTKVDLVVLLFLGALGTFLLARDVVRLPPPAALFAALLLLVSGWLPSMLLVGFWNQAFTLLVPLAAWCVLNPGAGRRRTLLGGMLLALLLQQGGHAFPAAVAFLAALCLAVAAADAGRAGTAALLALALPASLAFARALAAPWIAVLGLVAAGATLATPRAAPLLRALRPRLAALGLALGTACILGAHRILGLLYLRLRGATYDHALSRDGALWFPAGGRPWRLPNPDVAARGSDGFEGGRFYEGISVLLDGMLHRVPAVVGSREQFGRAGPPTEHEYAWLGLGWPGLLLALLGLGVVLLRRRRREAAPLVLVGLVCLGVCFGPNLPPDLNFLLTSGVPGLAAFAQPIKYWNFFGLLAAVACAGVAVDAIGARRPWLLGPLLLSLLWPALPNAAALGERFAQPRPRLPRAERFDQVALIDRIEQAGASPEAIARDAAAKHLREFRRAPEASEYDLSQAGTGLVSWYGTLTLPEHAVPARYVTPEGQQRVNPRYEGEAWVEAGGGAARVAALRTTPNRIEVEIEIEPGAGAAGASAVVVVVNQEALDPRDWRAEGASVEARDGLLALRFEAGSRRAMVHYRPGLLRAGLWISGIALVAWFAALLPARLWPLPALLGLAAALAWPAPRTPPTASWEASSLRAGGLGDLRVRVVAGNRGIPRGAELRLGFPHWVYGAGVGAPPGAESRAFGRWYVVKRVERRVPPGGAVDLELRGLQLPRSAGPGFRPEVFVDWEPVPGLADAAIGPGPAARLQIVAPALVEPGRPFSYRLRRLDADGNDVAEPELREHPGFAEPGVAWIEGAAPAPVLVEAGGPRIVWGDLHSHSGLSDGRGTPEDWFRAARRAGLDVAALSDHDWQLEEVEWIQLLAAADAANEDGAFVTIPAREVNLFGHEVAYFFDPLRLAGLRGGARGGATEIWAETDLGRPGALPAPLPGGGLGDDWLLATHSSLSANMGTGYPLPAGATRPQAFEVYSAHGSSECRGCARETAGGELAEGERVGSLHDALDSGLRPILLAAGDGHDGRPGDPAWGSFSGGLAGLEVEELSRAGVRDAFRRGRVWGTSGERTLLQVRWPSADTARVRVLAPIAVEALEVVAERRVVRRIEAPPPGVWLELAGLPPARWRYVRVLLAGDARAWGGTWFAGDAD